MMLRTKGEQKAYLDGYEICAKCIRNYLTDEGKQKLECLLMAVRNAVEIEACEEYENDLKTIMDEILEEGDQLISKKDLLRRFKEIDEEYKGMSWNLLQILANINIFIGHEDVISRQVVKEQMLKYGFHAPDMTVTEFIEDLPSVLPKRERSDKE